MRKELLLGFCLSVSTCLAQVSQQGQTLLYRGAQAKTPLEGVSISAYGAPSTISDSKGQFTLNFRLLHEGDKVNVRRLEKAGYEVFNNEAMEQWYITRSYLSYQIVMCESATLMKLKDRYREAAIQACTERIQKDEAHEEEQHKKGLITEEEYLSRIEQLEAEHEKLLDKIDTYVDRIARIDLSVISKEEQQIIALVEAGKFDDAIAAYDKLKLVEKYRTERASVQKLEDAKKKIQQAQEKHEAASNDLYEAAQRQVNLLRMAGGKDNIIKARQVISSLFWADSTQARPALDLARFLIDHHDYEEADHVLQAVLPHCHNWRETTNVKSLMASIQTIWHNYDASQKILQECIEHCQQNVVDDEESSLSPLLTLYNTYFTMAANSFQLDQDSLTDLYNQKALVTAQRIFAIDSTRTQLLAKTHFSRGNYLMAFGRFEESNNYLQKCLDLYSTLPESKVDIQTRARCKGILAQVLTQLEQKERALSLTNESIADIEILYQRNPTAHIYDLGLAKFQAAILFQTYGEMQQFQEYIDASIALFELMAQKNPQAFNPIVEKLKQHREEGLNAATDNQK